MSSRFQRATAIAIVLLVALTVAAANDAPLSADLQLRIQRQIRVIAAVPPDAEIAVGTPHASLDMEGFDEVRVTIRQGTQSKSFKFYLSRDRKRLLYVKQYDLSEDPFERVMHTIDVNGRPWRGAATPVVTAVLYDDFQCPFCARMYITLMNEVMNKYRDQVRVVIKDFPQSELHPWAMDAAIAANCLVALPDEKKSAYWKYSDYVHTHQQATTIDWNASHDALAKLAEKDAGDSGSATVQACAARHDTEAINESKEEGRSLGVSATPGLFVNGAFYEGELTDEQIRAALDRALAEASQMKH